ncbi:putative inverted formin-2 [Apostichopus japonicus]|uniref:Putative inverted formin-2 n=1 Tax=Stichopus japonicus TaxID=307972 RepID=A0A2G8JKZ9_STIJA|nr:putative inverted formin-2 [Apostichopus japonicus]
MARTTHDALKELMSFVEKNPEVYKRIIAKRKLEGKENAGLLSFIKVKLLVAFQGEDYAVDSITNDDCKKEINKFQSDICEVFNYSQESKPKATRFSKRLEAKKQKKKSSSSSSKTDSKEETVSPTSTLTPCQEGSPLKDSEKVIVSPTGRPSIHKGTKKQKKEPLEENLMSPLSPPPPSTTTTSTRTRDS